jgi:hypothetical protein
MAQQTDYRFLMMQFLFLIQESLCVHIGEYPGLNFILAGTFPADLAVCQWHLPVRPFSQLGRSSGFTPDSSYRLHSLGDYRVRDQWHSHYSITNRLTPLPAANKQQFVTTCLDF